MIRKLYYKIKCILGLSEFDTKSLGAPFYCRDGEYMVRHEVKCRCGCDKLPNQKELKRLRKKMVISIKTDAMISDIRLIDGTLIKEVKQILGK